jgi:hypothetical protein
MNLELIGKYRMRKRQISAIFKKHKCTIGDFTKMNLKTIKI